jgi:hypothetical protein
MVIHRLECEVRLVPSAAGVSNELRFASAASLRLHDLVLTHTANFTFYLKLVTCV